MPPTETISFTFSRKKMQLTYHTKRCTPPSSPPTESPAEPFEHCKLSAGSGSDVVGCVPLVDVWGALCPSPMFSPWTMMKEELPKCKMDLQPSRRYVCQKQLFMQLSGSSYAGLVRDTRPNWIEELGQSFHTLLQIGACPRTHPDCNLQPQYCFRSASAWQPLESQYCLRGAGRAQSLNPDFP